MIEINCTANDSPLTDSCAIKTTAALFFDGAIPAIVNQQSVFYRSGALSLSAATCVLIVSGTNFIIRVNSNNALPNTYYWSVNVTLDILDDNN